VSHPIPPTHPGDRDTGEPDVLGVSDLTIKPVRHPGRWISGLVVVALAAAVVVTFARADISYPDVVGYLFHPVIIRGMFATLWLSIAAMLIGLVAGLLAAVMKLSQNPVMRTLASFYIWLFRGVPLLVQLLIWFNLAIVIDKVGIPGVWQVPTNDVMTPFLAALLGLGICEGAYVAEIVRSGIASVPEGQRDAASALGMSRGMALARIVLPQSFRVMVPPLGNEFITMLKNSSLAYTISYTELLRSANTIYTNNFLIIELLFTASIWYLVLTTVFSIGQSFLERRLARSAGRSVPLSLAARLRRDLVPARRK
jgi:polar amino acid transport system permease protein